MDKIRKSGCYTAFLIPLHPGFSRELGLAYLPNHNKIFAREVPKEWALKSLSKILLVFPSGGEFLPNGDTAHRNEFLLSEKSLRRCRQTPAHQWEYQPGFPHRL